jgi:iron complex outermembrane receptor protein
VQGAARYGGTFGDATYRVYSQWTAHGDTHLANGTAPGDAWDTLRAGARVDWKRGTNDWTLDGGVGSGAGHGLWNFIQGPAPGLPVLSDRSGSFHDGSALVRWTRHGRNGSTLEVQSTVAIARRSVNSTDGVTDNENAFDTAVQYHSRLGTRHDVVAGAGYRFVDSTTTSRSFAYSLTPADRRGAIVSVFGQDDIALTDRVRIALGAKVERDTVSGWSVQPTARFMWQPAADHHIWFSASRAIRTPSNTDLAIRINVAVVAGPGAPMVIGVLGNPDYQPEKFKDAEVGYRVGLRPGLSVDVTAFRGRYDGLQTNEPLAPVFEPVPGPPHLFLATRFDNRLNVDTSGLEVAVRFAPAETWRLDGTYSNIHLTPNLDARSRDAAAAAFDGNAPSHQWRLHSGITLGPRTEIDVALSRTGALSALAVPSHTRADARVEVRLTRHLSAALSARNLLKASHAEFVTGAVVSTQIPRSGDVRLVFRF